MTFIKNERAPDSGQITDLDFLKWMVLLAILWITNAKRLKL